jgi:ribose transport system permease protein
MDSKTTSQNIKSAFVNNGFVTFLKNNIEDFSRVLIVIFLVVTLSLVTTNFATFPNLMNVLRAASLNLILATGLAFTMLVSGIDLSIGSIIALSTMVFAPYFQEGRTILEMVYGIAGILVLSSAIGMINGSAVAFLRLPPFLVTFAIGNIARGLSYYLTRGTVFAKFTPTFRFIGSGELFGIPMPVIFAGLVLILVGLLLNKTVFGRRIYAVGSNREAAHYSGIKVNKTIISAYMLSALIAGFGGIIYLSRLNAAEAYIGLDFHLNAISAAAIGGISFKGGRGNVFGIIIGALLLTLVNNGMNLLGVQSDWQMGITGLIIIIGVLLDRSYTKRQE